MKNLESLTRDQVSVETKEVFDGMQKSIGMIPNLYAVAANSHAGLTALLGLGETLKKGVLTGKEEEAIALAVGQTNACNYCLSAHTALAKMRGFSEAETVKIRTGNIENTKIKSLTDLAKEITETRGFPSQNTIERFHQAGYNKAALVEVIGQVVLNTFTNYLNHIADTEIDFPMAPSLDNQAA